MNTYLISRTRNNTLEDAFIPSDMFDVHYTLPIHEGAKKYYKEIGWIEQKLIDNN
jgi:TRAP-type uncharacterized transport system substrate-binding protein